MAPNSAMKVPVFPIILSPSSPQITLRKGGEEGAIGQKNKEEKDRKKELTQKKRN